MVLNLGRLGGLGSLRSLGNIIPIILLTTSAGLSRPREAVAIVDCWVWQMATENQFSKSLISQRKLFAPANNSRKKTSLPHRHRLKVKGLGHRQKIGESLSTVAYLGAKRQAPLLTQT